MSQLRIFHLIKSLGQGGAEMLLRDGLCYSNRDIFAYGYGYFLPSKNALVPALKELGAEVQCFNTNHLPGMFASIPGVASFLKDWRADLVHCHLPTTGVVGRLAGRLSGVPVIYTEHNLMESYHPGTRWLNMKTWRLQKRVLAVSQDVQQSIFHHVGASVPVDLVRNGVAAFTFGPDPDSRNRVRRELAIPPEVLVVGTVAVLRPEKNLNAWLEAAVLIKKDHPSVHFLLVGDGEVMKELRLKAAQLNLGECLHFAGFQDRVKPYLAAMDVYMISSNFEGLPVALLEAMAMDLPVVATRVGGIPEVILESETGFLVEPRSPSALAKAVGVLLLDPNRRSSFGKIGRARVESDFDIRRSVCRTEQIYQEVLEENHNGR